MKKYNQGMPDHKWKFSLTYKGLYVVMGTTLICPPIVMLSYSTLYEGASKCNFFFLHSYVNKKEKKKKKKKKENLDWKLERVVYVKGKQKNESKGAC